MKCWALLRAVLIERWMLLRVESTGFLWNIGIATETLSGIKTEQLLHTTMSIDWLEASTLLKRTLCY